MRKDIIIWSLGLEALAGNIKSIDAFQTAKAAGFEGVELALHEFGSGGDITVNLQKNAEGGLVGDGVETVILADNVHQAQRQTGLVSDCLSTGLYWGYSLSANDELTRRTALNIAKAQIQAAHDLSLKYILLVPGAVKVTFDPKSEKVPYQAVWERASKAIGEELEPLAKKLGVIIGLENVGNDFLLIPGEFKKFIDQFKSPYVRMYFDAANVVYNSRRPCVGDPAYWIGELGDRIAKVHIKDFLAGHPEKDINGLGCNIGEGIVPLERTISALKKIGYEGSIAAEVMLFGQQALWTPDVPTKASAAMNKLLGGKYLTEAKYQPQQAQ
jgi:hexulose-6-phosphate isomerase